MSFTPLLKLKANGMEILFNVKKLTLIFPNISCFPLTRDIDLFNPFKPYKRHCQNGYFNCNNYLKLLTDFLVTFLDMIVESWLFNSENEDTVVYKL